MKKSITINVVLIVLSVVVAYAVILLMPFFWKWYECKLGIDASKQRFSFSVLSSMVLTLNLIINIIFIANKLYDET